MAPSQRLAKKVAIITGSSSGIGRAISLLYASEGALVVCADLQSSARSEVPEEIDIDTDQLIRRDGGQAIFVKTDVGHAKEIQDLVATTVAQFGRVDIIEARMPARIHETDEEVWDMKMRVNAKSVFLGCKYALVQMLEQDPHPSGDRGWIINMSSIMGIIADQENPSYCASKGAVSNLTRQVALDYAQYRIHCNAICPGYTQTAIFVQTTSHKTPVSVLHERHPLRGAGKPEDVAKLAVVLADDDASWITGACIPVDGGYTAL